MGKFMRWMQRELKGIKRSEIKPTDYEVKLGEEVLGVLTDAELKKLSVLRARLRGQLAALIKEKIPRVIELAKTRSESDHDPAPAGFV